MPKWLKYALLVLGPVVLVAGIIYSLSGKSSPVPDQYVFGDVMTGEIVTLKKGSFASFPVKNKEGKRTLFPVTKQPDGSYVVTERYREALTSMTQSGTIPKDQLKVDLQSYRITSSASGS
jgi:hypothetical protein